MPINLFVTNFSGDTFVTGYISGMDVTYVKLKPSGKFYFPSLIQLVIRDIPCLPGHKLHPFFCPRAVTKKAKTLYFIKAQATGPPLGDHHDKTFIALLWLSPGIFKLAAGWRLHSNL